MNNMSQQLEEEQSKLLESLFPLQIEYISKIAQKMNHAYCVSGIDQGAQDAFVLYWASHIYCPAQCGTCIHCTELQKGTHLDLLIVDREQEQPVIKIEQAHEICQFVTKTPRLGSYRIVVLQDIHALTMQAANALLKVIEEPPPSTIFLVSTSKPDMLPQTLLSRMQRVWIPSVSEDQCVSVLKDQSKDIYEARKRGIIYVSGRFQLLHLLVHGSDEEFDQWVSQYEAWESFLSASLQDRQSLVQQLVGKEMDKKQLANVSGQLSILERVLHRRLRADCTRYQASNSALSMKEVCNHTITQLQQIAKTIRMCSDQGNKKMIIDYLLCTL